MRHHSGSRSGPRHGAAATAVPDGAATSSLDTTPRLRSSTAGVESPEPVGPRQLLRAYRKRVTLAPRARRSPRGDQRAAGQCGSAYGPTSLCGCAPRTLLPPLTACGQGSTQTKKNKILLRIFFELL